MGCALFDVCDHRTQEHCDCYALCFVTPCLFVHVYVERATQRPVAIPEPTRSALSELLSGDR
jgi:hypothetical protein